MLPSKHCLRVGIGCFGSTTPVPVMYASQSGSLLDIFSTCQLKEAPLLWGWTQTSHMHMYLSTDMGDSFTRTPSIQSVKCQKLYILISSTKCHNFEGKSYVGSSLVRRVNTKMYLEQNLILNCLK